MTTHEIVTREQWIGARQALLAEEKAWTRERDRLAAKRRALPWVRIDKPYNFESPAGPIALAELFDGRSQLIVYHFMFGPEWDEGCTGCSLLCDHVDGARQHFEQNDLSFVAISRGPIGKIEAYRKRMGWRFRWVSSANSDFNFDYNVSFPAEARKAGVFYNFTQKPDPEIDELPGASVFQRDADGTVYHTYSTFGRGLEIALGVYAWLDMAPKGRNETAKGNLMDWVKRHDQYAMAAEAASCCAQP